MKYLNGESVIYAFEANMTPVLKVENGEEITVKTNDCFMQQVNSESDLVSDIDFNHVNPATGPIYVDGAKIGDVLKVEIIDIKVADQGCIVTLPGAGALGEQVKESITRVISIENDSLDYLGYKAKIDPMIGVIGVSPGPKQKAVETGTPYNHGGNMDTTDVRKGATLYFPVYEEGAFLALGDCHAIMGDGELCVSGLEIQAKVTLKVSIVKDLDLNWPVLENENEFMVIASEPSLDEAVVSAATELTNLLNKFTKMSWEEAYIFNSLFVDYKISQVVNPMKTVRAVVSKEKFSIEEIIKEKKA